LILNRRLPALLSLALMLPQVYAADAPTLSISVDASRSNGRIKHLNDVDGGPLCQRGIVDLTGYYKQLGIRNTRLHDVPWSYDNVVDMNYVFPDWNADPAQAANYDFSLTDYYLKTISDLGINIIYRLGYSAEYKTSVYHRAPPDSFSKWAEIATNIARHYSDGWASGQKDYIKYWEIWNEPNTSVAWTGTAEQYFQLYAITAQRLKALNPSFKVGGPVAGSLEYIDGFLKYQREHHIAVDFVSWHSYKRNPQDVVDFANKLHELMVRDGFPQAESILDEWNYGPLDWKTLFGDADTVRTYFDATQSSLGASYDAAVLIGLQDAPIDMATFYSGTTFMWGLFTSSGAPQKPYYAFLAFRRLLDTPKRLAVKLDPASPVRALAGVSEDQRMVRILMSNPSKSPVTVQIKLEGLPWKGPSQYEQQVVNDEYNLQTIVGLKPLTQKVGSQSVVLLTVRPVSASGAAAGK
jgi:xylan 1,4-beta-xylosidase